EDESEGGCGCPYGRAADDVAGGVSDGGSPPDGDVIVHDRGSTATYDYVVVGGTEGGSIVEWLSDNGFAVPADYQATIDEYVAEDWLFMAAKVSEAGTEGTLAPLEMHFPSFPDAAGRVCRRRDRPGRSRRDFLRYQQLRRGLRRCGTRGRPDLGARVHQRLVGAG
ncbi:MAG: DUF2330 domain-containing protein, partial [Deltaproteobacteria bacterium]|nr:DUF2330 domain-containing protein [Deltaproteobacteria bacterium]